MALTPQQINELRAQYQNGGIAPATGQFQGSQTPSVQALPATSVPQTSALRLDDLGKPITQPKESFFTKKYVMGGTSTGDKVATAIMRVLMPKMIDKSDKTLSKGDLALRDMGSSVFKLMPLPEFAKRELGAGGIKNALRGTGLTAATLLELPFSKGNTLSEAWKNTSVQKQFPHELMKDKGILEKAGALAEGVGEFMAVGAGATATGAAVKTGIAGAANPGFLAKAAGFVTQAILDTAGTFGVTALQEGKAGDKAWKNAEFTAKVYTVLGALGVAGKAVRGIQQLLTGVSPGTLERAAANPNTLKYIEAAKKNPIGFQDDIVKEAQAAADKYLQANKAVVGARLDTAITHADDLKAYHQGLIDDIRNSAKQGDDLWYGVKLPDDIRTNEGAVSFIDTLLDPGIAKDATKNSLDLSQSSIVVKRDIAKKALDKVLNQKDISARGYETLKQQLWTLADQADDLDSQPAHSFIMELWKKVRTGLSAHVDDYDEIMGDYGQIKEFQGALNHSLRIGSKADAEQVLQKMLQALGTKSAYKSSLLSKLDAVADTDIIGKLTAMELTSWVPKSLAGKGASIATGALQGGAVAKMIMNPIAALGNPLATLGTLAAAGTGAALSSPKLSALTNVAASKATSAIAPQISKLIAMLRTLATNDPKVEAIKQELNDLTGGRLYEEPAQAEPIDWRIRPPVKPFPVRPPSTYNIPR